MRLVFTSQSLELLFGLGVIRGQSQRFAKFVHRLLPPALQNQDGAQVGVNGRAARLGMQGGAILRCGLFQFALTGQQIAQVAMSGGVRGTQAKGLLQFGHRFVGFAQGGQSSGDIAVRVGLLRV